MNIAPIILNESNPIPLYVPSAMANEFNFFKKTNPTLAYTKIVDSPMQLAERLIPFLQDIESGFFIETGANNGVFQSNTLFLEKAFNWKGILIEPNKNSYEQCKVFRPNSLVLNYALVEDDNINEIEGYFAGKSPEDSLTGKIVGSDNGINKEQEKIKVRATTLTKILEAHKVQNIDFFSLDVEGYEKQVLDGLDFRKWQPKLICLEALEREKFWKIKQKLGDFGYIMLAQLTKHDFLFKHAFRKTI